MRKEFSEMLHQKMQTNKKIYLLTADLGYKMWDSIKRDYPNRFCNVGASEQLLVGAAIGLSYAGFVPIVYSITPFLLCRPFELLRTYVNYENINIKLIGSGRNKDYDHDGISHWATDDKDIVKLLYNIRGFHPENISELKEIFEKNIDSNLPVYINLKRKI